MPAQLIALLFLLKMPSSPINADTSGITVLRVDSIQMTQLTATKVVAYEYHETTFLFDYKAVHQQLSTLIKQPYHTGAVKASLQKIEREINNSDTAYLSQATFDQLHWVPFDWFICDQLSSRSCLVKNSKNTLQPLVIKTHVMQWYNGRIGWTGWRYYFPEMTKHFFECTESES